jgi:hypothetical protein
VDAYTQNVLDRLRVNASYYERKHKALGLSDLLRDAADLLDAWAERAEHAISQATQTAQNNDMPMPVTRQITKQRRPRLPDVDIAERRPAPACEQYEKDLNQLLKLIKELHK